MPGGENTWVFCCRTPPTALGATAGTVTVTVFEVADEVLAPCVPDVEAWFEITTAEAAASMRAQK